MSEHNDEKHPPSSQLGIWMIAAAWVVLLLIATKQFAGSENKKRFPNQNAQAELIAGSQRLVLKATKDNHYLAHGSVNGRPANFLLDTGATTVAIPENLQAYYNLPGGAKSFAYTANGRIGVIETNIAELNIGGIVLTEINATLNPGMNYSDTILLGMSALSLLGVNINDGELTLTQPERL